MLINVFLHAEFISAMKTVENPTIFMKNAKNSENMFFRWKRRQIKQNLKTE